MATHGMTIAKASKDDFEKVYNLLSPMEELFNSNGVMKKNGQNGMMVMRINRNFLLSARK